MSVMQIKKAERKQAKIRLGFSGPAGSGKTMSALKVARGLVGNWEQIVVIDTENNSADLYSHLGSFSVLPLEKPYSPERFIEAIELAEDAGFKCIIIDSISHEWEGPGGILDIIDAMGGKMWHWKEVTPRHQKLVNAILSSKAHVISTLRTKSDYAISKDDKNKTVVEKVGLKPVTREGFDYELTLNFDLDINNHAKASKDRTNMFMRAAPFVLDEAVGEKILKWCQCGTAQPEKQTAQTEFEAKKGITKAEPTKVQEFTPEQIAEAEAQRLKKEEGERRKARLERMPEDVISYFREQKFNVGKMIAILDENDDDPVRIRAFIQESTQAALSTGDLAEQLKDEQVTTSV